MKILEGGSIYIEKGELFPLKCPECGIHLPFRKQESVVCGMCHHRGCIEDFSNVTYEMETIH
jgi:uncharacterized Zn finger protein (UPF0148 family)